ncbi:MAG: septum formation inhibitor Maf [Pseudomonadales bacterium]|nr:septum formation inhibitor Maf [Pseudomonadales bacterium]
MSYSFYLASGSPRRMELLSQIGLQYQQILPSVDETKNADESPVNFVKRLAKLKAEAGRDMLPEAQLKPVLGADTIVVLDGRVFGKPKDNEEAFTMLMALSGHTHQVMTAVTVVTPSNEKTLCVCSKVTFRNILPEEARAYAKTGEPMDKAGAYAVQGVGAIFVEKIEGSYSAIVGLPLMETASLLREFGVPTLASD